MRCSITRQCNCHWAVLLLNVCLWLHPHPPLLFMHLAKMSFTWPREAERERERERERACSLFVCLFDLWVTVSPSLPFSWSLGTTKLTCASNTLTRVNQEKGGMKKMLAHFFLFPNFTFTLTGYNSGNLKVSLHLLWFFPLTGCNFVT